jgi:hypothetical protein
MKPTVYKFYISKIKDCKNGDLIKNTQGAKCGLLNLPMDSSDKCSLLSESQS